MELLKLKVTLGEIWSNTVIKHILLIMITNSTLRLILLIQTHILYLQLYVVWQNFTAVAKLNYF